MRGIRRTAALCITRPMRRSYVYIPGVSLGESCTPPVSPVTTSFHELTSGGYNGRLASAYLSMHSNRAERLLEVMRQMEAHGERPSGLISYNYMFAGLLEAGRRGEAFALLREMEGRGIEPDTFTFEIFMGSLSGNRALAMTVEELFQLMRIKYRLEATPACWEARLCAWLSPSQEARVIRLLDELREEGRARYCSALYERVLLSAVQHGAWNVASHILTMVVPRAPGVPADAFNIVLPAKAYEQLLIARGTRMSVRAVPVLRTALEQLAGAQDVSEGAYVHILYFAAGIGSAVADMAFHALSRISAMYARQGTRAVPRPYLEAFVECATGRTEEGHLRHPYYLQARLDPQHIQLARKIAILLNSGSSGNVDCVE